MSCHDEYDVKTIFLCKVVTRQPLRILVADLRSSDSRKSYSTTLTYDGPALGGCEAVLSTLSPSQPVSPLTQPKLCARPSPPPFTLGGDEGHRTLYNHSSPHLVLLGFFLALLPILSFYYLQSYISLELIISSWYQFRDILIIWSTTTLHDQFHPSDIHSSS